MCHHVFIMMEEIIIVSLLVSGPGRSLSFSRLRANPGPALTLKTVHTQPRASLLSPILREDTHAVCCGRMATLGCPQRLL